MRPIVNPDSVMSSFLKKQKYKPRTTPWWVYQLLRRQHTPYVNCVLQSTGRHCGFFMVGMAHWVRTSNKKTKNLSDNSNTLQGSIGGEVLYKNYSSIIIKKKSKNKRLNKKAKTPHINAGKLQKQSSTTLHWIRDVCYGVRFRKCIYFDLRAFLSFFPGVHQIFM